MLRYRNSVVIALDSVVLVVPVAMVGAAVDSGRIVTLGVMLVFTVSLGLGYVSHDSEVWGLLICYRLEGS